MRAILVTAAVLMAGAARAVVVPHPQAEAQALDLAEKAIAIRSVRRARQQDAARSRRSISRPWSRGASPTPTLRSRRSTRRRPHRLSDRALARQRSQPQTGGDFGPHGRGRGQAGRLAARSVHAGGGERLSVRARGHRHEAGRHAGDRLADRAQARGLQTAADDHHRVLRRRGNEDEDQRHHRPESSPTAELVLNIDGGGGTLDEATGAPEYFTWQGAEKTYADFQLTVTNPGGHSSEPRAVNAIDELAAGAAAHRRPTGSPPNSTI